MDIEKISDAIFKSLLDIENLAMFAQSGAQTNTLLEIRKTLIEALEEIDDENTQMFKIASMGR